MLLLATLPSQNYATASHENKGIEIALSTNVTS
jgi:hypothetical protein